MPSTTVRAFVHLHESIRLIGPHEVFALNISYRWRGVRNLITGHTVLVPYPFLTLRAALLTHASPTSTRTLCSTMAVIKHEVYIPTSGNS